MSDMMARWGGVGAAMVIQFEFDLTLCFDFLSAIPEKDPKVFDNKEGFILLPYCILSASALSTGDPRPIFPNVASLQFAVQLYRWTRC